MISTRWKCEWAGFLVRRVIVGAVIAISISGAQADIPNAVEPDYAEAVLNYSSKNYDRAVAILNEIQAKAPDSVEILELKAIALKASNKSDQAGKVYLDLIRLKSKDSKDKKEIAPYAFEMGMLRFNEKNFGESEKFFDFAAKNDFNKDVSIFYLGMISMQTEKWDAAEARFREVLDGRTEDMKPAAQLYIAQTYFKRGEGSTGFNYLIDARRAAKAVIARDDLGEESKAMSKQVLAAADKTLGPFDKAAWFGSFSVNLGYDSNIVLAPSDVTGSSDITGKSTFKSTLALGVGYASSPLNMYQFVPSLKFNVNRNFNNDSRSYEFADTTLSVYMNRNALASNTWGAHAEYTTIFQNDYDTAAQKSLFRLYNTTITLAPYLKNELSKRLNLSSELGAKFNNYNGDDTVSDTLKRSGVAPYLRFSLTHKAPSNFWKPIYSARIERNKTKGTEYRSTLLGLSVANGFQWKDLDWSQTLDLSKTDYPDSSTTRADKMLYISAAVSKKLTPKVSALFSLDFTQNWSSDASSYEYNRYNLTTGVTYSF